VDGKAVLGTILALFMLSLLLSALDVHPVKASSTIYIRADGSVDPPTSPIQRNGDVYTLTGNVNDSIVVERDNITLDGAGYTVEGARNGIGIALSFRRNVTIQNFRVIEFWTGITLENSNECMVFDNNVAENGQYGIYLISSGDNLVFLNNVTNNGQFGIYLKSSGNNLIDDNVAANNAQTGIRLEYSSNNTVSFNTAKENMGWAGIWLFDSPNSTVCCNTVVNNNRGIGLGLSGGSEVYDNVMLGNRYSFDVNGYSSSHFDINVHLDNIADGRPILYIVNSSNTVIDSSYRASAIYFIDSMNITIRDITLGNNVKGVFFWKTNNSRIENVLITGNDYGIELEYSNNISISGNTIANNGRYGIYGSSCDSITCSGNTVTDNTNWGIYLSDSSGSILSDNTITKNAYGLNYLVDSGIRLLGSGNILSDNIITNNARGIYLVGSGNILYGNTITNNVEYGISISYSSGNNTIFKNNIMNNQVVDPSEAVHINTWDDGATGNYWGDYKEKYPNATEVNGSGIWNISYVIDEDSQDNYPLIEPWSRTRTFNITWDEETYKVGTLSNSLIASLTFNQTYKQISFKTTGSNGTSAFCKVTLPKELLDAPPNQWTITVNGEAVSLSVTENTTHTFIYFIFTHSTQIVNIIGTDPIDHTKPVANAGQEQTANEDTIVTFDGSASTDNVRIVSYIWTFIDNTPQTLTGFSPTYTFRTPGTYIVTLDVTDPRNNSDTDSVKITVLDTTPPVADAGPDQLVNEDVLFTFDGSGTTDNVAPTGYTWRFMDMTPQTLTGKNPTYTFQTPGIYIVTLNVTDAAGKWHTEQVTITVVDATKPTADAGFDQKVYVGTPLTFNASASSDNVNIVTYTWTFIDQTPQILSGPNPSYVFSTPGTYIISLNVADAAGKSDSCNLIVTVRAVPVWTQSWFWAIILLIPTTSGLSYLGFRYRRREGIFEQLQKLVRLYVRDEITPEAYKKRLREIEKRSDLDSRARIKEFLDVIMAHERALAYTDRRKLENE